MPSLAQEYLWNPQGAPQRLSVFGEQVIQFTWSDEPGKWRDYASASLPHAAESLQASFAAVKEFWKLKHDIVVRVAPTLGGTLIHA